MSSHHIQGANGRPRLPAQPQSGSQSVGSSDEKTPLFRPLTMMSSLDTVRLHLENNGDVTRPINGVTPLMIALAHESVDIFQKLLDHPSTDPNSPSISDIDSTPILTFTVAISKAFNSGKTVFLERLLNSEKLNLFAVEEKILHNKKTQRTLFSSFHRLSLEHSQSNSENLNKIKEIFENRLSWYLTDLESLIQKLTSFFEYEETKSTFNLLLLKCKVYHTSSEKLSPLGQTVLKNFFKVDKIDNFQINLIGNNFDFYTNFINMSSMRVVCFARIDYTFENSLEGLIVFTSVFLDVYNADELYHGLCSYLPLDPATKTIQNRKLTSLMPIGLDFIDCQHSYLINQKLFRNTGL